jgi:hypothetical protein
MENTMHWWDWKRAQRALETWVRVLIGSRPYAVRYGPREGSFVRFDTQEIVVDPVMAEAWGGERLLPLTWRGQTVTTLAGLEWRIARTMGRHEAGHVLFTGGYRVAGELHAWLVNALEDGRMEALTGAFYPPAGADFLALARLLAERMPLPDPHTRSREDVLLNACLFERWDCKRPSSARSRFRFRTADDERLWERDIKPLVEEAWRALDIERVCELALEILRRIGIPEHDGTRGRVLLAVDVVAHPSERQVGDEPLHIPGTLKVVHSNAGGEGTGPDITADHTEVVGTVTVDEGEPPGVDTDPSAGRLWMRPYDWLVREVSGETRRLLQALRASASDVASRRSATRGTFSARAYARTRGEQPLLVYRDPDDDPSGLAIVLLIDRTTSMGGPPTLDPANPEPGPSFFDEHQRMTHARRAAMLFELTCTAAGIPLSIGFAGDRGYSVHLPHALGRQVFFQRPGHPVTWLRTWETPRFAEGPKALIAGLYGDSMSERASASLREAEARLASRREGTKLVLYIHDGVPTDERADEVAATVAELRRHGIVVLGVFVGEQDQLSLLQRVFGVEHTVPVTELAALSKRLGRLLLKYTSTRR